MISLFVRNLPGRCSDEQLREMFRPYGRIAGVHFVFSGGRADTRFAFVEMNSYEAAHAVERALDGRHMEGHQFTVETYTPF